MTGFHCKDTDECMTKEAHKEDCPKPAKSASREVDEGS